MTLQELGIYHQTDKAFAHQYCDFYEQHLPKPEEFKGRLLEIGVKDGASLRMWRDYYRDAKEIVGIDITPALRIPGCTILQMDSADVYALQSLGKFDIVIDDGSHMTRDQQAALMALWPMLNKGGIFIMEDLHTSFYPSYINSKFTTYQIVSEFPEKLEWCRVEDKSDSLTTILWK